jgi:uncharacterized protein with HEPN domain
MQPEQRDDALLLDMSQAAKEIFEFIEGVNFQEFQSNRVIRYAVERQILVIGEAAAHVSLTFKDAHPEIPWSSIIAQRNILAHEYGEIIVERIWLVATEYIPELIKLLGPLIPEPPEQDL